MRAVEVAAALCRQFEGFRPSPYLCPAGYPTIGFGTVNKPDGTKVTLADAPIDLRTANEWLLRTIRLEYLPGVLAASPILAGHPEALGAMVDFAYNLGVPRYRASTLRRKVNQEDWDGAKLELMKWVYGGGKKLPGLVKRRTAEAALLG
jgi:lysozyme